MNNFDKFLNTAGEVNSVTVGKFTVFDAENTSGTGCTGISLTGPFNSGNPGYDYSVEDEGWQVAATNTQSDVIGPDTESLPVRAVADDGSSFLLGFVGDMDDDTTTLPSGLQPCADVGGLSGS